jgi:hypothetical protein
MEEMLTMGFFSEPRAHVTAGGRGCARVGEAVRRGHAQCSHAGATGMDEGVS